MAYFSICSLQFETSQCNGKNRVAAATQWSTLGLKARDTLQEERYRLNVTVPHADLDNLNAYLGCSNCGKKTGLATGEQFKCENCLTDDVLSEPRITFNCEVSDGTDSLDITVFTSDAVKILQMTAPDIFHMKLSNDTENFQRKHGFLKRNGITIEVSPKMVLSGNNILQWGLREILMNQEIPSTSETTMDPIPLTENINKQITSTEIPVARKLSFATIATTGNDPSITPVTVPPVTTVPDPQPQTIEPQLVAQKNNTSTVSVTAQGPVPSIPPKLASLSATLLPSPTTKKQTASPSGKVHIQPTNIQGPAASLQSTPTKKTDALIIHDITEIDSQAHNPLSTTPILKTPKLEKTVTHSPETPAQTTPKRTTGPQKTVSPSKKKKTTITSPNE